MAVCAKVPKLLKIVRAQDLTSQKWSGACNELYGVLNYMVSMESRLYVVLLRSFPKRMRAKRAYA